MKFVSIVLGLSLASTPVLARTITLSQVPMFIDETVSVEGVVREVHVTGDGTTFIDLGKPYPDQLFTGVIFSGDTGAFGDLRGLNGKTVDLHGTIKMYRGKPEIILQSADQITVH